MGEIFQVQPTGWIRKQGNDVCIDIECFTPDRLSPSEIRLPDRV
ncbi:hypothetical protein [Desulfosarcina sp.]